MKGYRGRLVCSACIQNYKYKDNIIYNPLKCRSVKKCQYKRLYEDDKIDRIKQNWWENETKKQFGAEV